MAISLKSKAKDSGKSFFQTALCKPQHAKLLARALALIEAGVTFEVSFYGVKADLAAFKKEHVAAVLPLSTTAVMKQSMDSMQEQVVMDKLEKLVSHTESLVGGTKVTPTPVEEPLIEGLKFSNILATETPTTPKKPAIKKAPKTFMAAGTQLPSTEGVVSLKDADKLGQSVKGTSTGSVYKVVAIGERVKMAVRREGAKLSFRVEGKPSSFEAERLKAMGFQLHKPTAGGMYFSSHVTLGNLPPSRVLGAVIFGSDVPFIETISHADEVFQ